MSEIERLRGLVFELTEGCAPSPWHGVRSGDPAAYSTWLENAAGDSSFPDPDDVAVMVNALPALLDVAEIARDYRAGDTNAWLAMGAALDRLDGAS